MEKYFRDKDCRRVSALLRFFQILLIVGICFFAFYGTSQCQGGGDEGLRAELKLFCSNLDPFYPDPDDLAMCNDLFPPGGGGTTSNLSTVSAQGRAANVLANQHKGSIEDRLDELKSAKNKVKKNVMPDGGENVNKFLKGFGFFLAGRYADTDRDQTHVEIGYDAELKGGTFGIDYRFNDKFVAGVAAGYSVENADFNRDTGHLNTDSSNVTLYCNAVPFKDINFDGYLGYTNIDYRSRRFVDFGNVKGLIGGHTDGRQYTAGFAASYDWHYGAFSIGPQVKLDYVNTHINNYTETSSALAMKYLDQTIHSTTTNLGFQTSYAQSFSWGVLVPHSRLYWVHQYKNESRDITSSVAGGSAAASQINNRQITDNPDRNYMNFGAGVSAVLPHGVQLFADYDTIFSHEFLHIWTASAGFKMEF